VSAYLLKRLRSHLSKGNATKLTQSIKRVKGSLFWLRKPRTFQRRTPTAELQAEVERAQSRAVRAEQWLVAIKGEIEDKLIAPIEANRREPPVVH
jgi:hypothetical protein